MGKLIARRLGLSIFILLAVSVIIFCATLLLPGDPARAILGQQATPERIDALQAEMNLDKNPVERYFLWLGGVLTGDFGTSTTTGGPVSELLGEPLVNSLVLMALAALIAIPLGILVGIYAAWWRG
ncbi:ABC transporter permease, partial [Rhizobium leguminosarum]